MLEDMGCKLVNLFNDGDILQSFMSEEVKFLSEAGQCEFELYYLKDEIKSFEFIKMLDYLMKMDCIVMLIRFVYKHSAYILEDYLLKEDNDIIIMDEKKEILIDRINQLNDIYM